MNQPTSIKREQFRQAKQVHGGLWKFLVAVAGVRLARLWIPTKRLRLSVFRSVFGKKYPPGINEDEYLKSMYLMCYYLIALITIPYQGGMALYYLRRRRPIAAALAPESS